MRQQSAQSAVLQSAKRASTIRCTVTLTTRWTPRGVIPLSLWLEREREFRLVASSSESKVSELVE